MTRLPAAIFAPSRRALALAERVQPALGDAGIVVPTELGPAGDATYARLNHAVAEAFAAGRPIVGICAAGILIRAVAPLLADKREEPPVLALAIDGSSIVPLLGGHHGGNALAREIATVLGITASITTAGDLGLGVALDEPPPGWRIADPERVKPVAAALLAGKPVILQADAEAGDWLRGLAIADVGTHSIRITDRVVPPGDAALVYHPPVLALGVGCERGAPPEQLEQLVRDILAEAGLSPLAIAAIVSIDIKSDEAAIHDLAEKLGVPARFYPPAALLAETERLSTRSEIVFRTTGCWGVAEGAALAAAGPQGTLIVTKRRSARATIAIARSPRALDATALGQARGKLRILGIGPGAAKWRTPEVTSALRAATHIVGYGLYLDLVAPLIAGKQRHESALGEETARVEKALDLAAAGHDVALISSGDAGIYALATLVFERVDLGQRPDWRRIEIAVAPGISALQAAAAGAGAPLGHDFCAISLSDLLTPWETIRARLEAAAAGDFVVALYNPRSGRRNWQLAEARDILLAARGGAVPVILARNLGRETEEIRRTTLGDFDPDSVDMLTLVTIGSRATRFVDGTNWIYTPRGYAGKTANQEDTQT